MYFDPVLALFLSIEVQTTLPELELGLQVQYITETTGLTA